MPGSLSSGVPDPPSTFVPTYGSYSRGRRGNRDYLAGLREQRQEEAQRAREAAADAREARAEASAQAREAHENFRDSIALQNERFKAAAQAMTFARDSHKQEREIEAMNHVTNFYKFYHLLKDEDPNRKSQLDYILQRFPRAVESAEVRQQIKEDDARLNVKPQLTNEEAKFLSANGPGTKGGDALEKTIRGIKDPAQMSGKEMAATLNYGRAWDLMKKQIGQPTGTPQGQPIEDYAKGVWQRLQPTSPTAPTPATVTGNPPPPSTPGPQSIEGWANTPLPQTAPINETPGTQPAAQPTVNPGARQWMDNIKQKTSAIGGVGAANVADARSDINDTLNESPETQFIAPKNTGATGAAPPPTPTPPPQQPNQFYTA